MARQVPLRVFKDGIDARLDATKSSPTDLLYHTTRSIEGIEEEGMIMPVSKIGGDTGTWLSEVPAFTQDRKYAFEIPINALEEQKLEAGEEYRGKKSRDIGRWGKWYVYREIIPLKDVVRVLYWTGGDPHKMPLNDVAEEVVLNEEEEAGRDALYPDIGGAEAEKKEEMPHTTSKDLVKYMGKKWEVVDKEESEYINQVRYDLKEVDNPENTREGIREKSLEEI